MSDNRGVPIFLFLMILGFGGLFFIGRGCDSIKYDWEKAEEESKEQKLRAAEQVKLQQAEQARQDQIAAAAERDRLAELEKQKEIEAKRTPDEWATLALQALDDKGKSAEDKVCEALKSIDRIPKEKRSTSIVWKAINGANIAEQAALSAQRKGFEATRTVVCSDGTGSSCLCNSARRGCCSHHGGVSGCVPYPTKLLCSK